MGVGEGGRCLQPSWWRGSVQTSVPRIWGLAFICGSQPHRLALPGVPALPGEHLSISSSEMCEDSVCREASLLVNVGQLLTRVQLLPASRME